MTAATTTAETLFANRRNLKALGNYSEEDTVSHLIDPVLFFLGYPVTHQRRELQSGGNRPDIVMYNVPAGLAGNRPADVILEAKPLGHDLEGKGKARGNRPKSQQRRYLLGHEASHPGTYGFLTDGNIWYTTKRTAPDSISLVNEWRLLNETETECAKYLLEIKATLSQEETIATSSSPSAKTRKADEICRAIAKGSSPNSVLRLLTGKDGERELQNAGAQLTGKAEQAEKYEWKQYAYAYSGKFRYQGQQPMINQDDICVAVVRATDAESEDDAVLYREDVAVAAKAFARTAPAKISVVLMMQPDENGEPASVRLAIHYQGHTGMTTEFNPYTPSPKALRTIQRIHDQLNKKTPVQAKTLVNIVAAKGVRKEFYEKITEGWTLRQYRKATGSQKQRHAYREAVLRHLIRTVFAWILKEDGKLPPEVFDEAFAKREAKGDYYGQILTFMFHERLNQSEPTRTAHSNQEIEKALDGTRFLNGSLFARHQDDGMLQMSDADYFGTDQKSPGLFTILSEYDWTASEHTPHSSDQTIDPEVLSNLFENLIAVTQYGTKVPDRMPAGTYYTPADIALEMVKDALAEAVKDFAPQHWTKADLRELFGDEDAGTPEPTEVERQRLATRIRELTIYDPAVGSGEFPYTACTAIRMALQKLGTPDENGVLTRDIISRQLFAQDINPMAVQVTRLRLFIAIIAQEDSEQTNHIPLPNLEGRIICADTLATNPSTLSQAKQVNNLGSTNPEVSKALTRRARIISRWLTAHAESEKEQIKAEDSEASKALKLTVGENPLFQEISHFADAELLNPNAAPVRIDPRILFYDENWQGFDIVIGNPPYETFSKMDRGWTNEQLAQRGYTTTKGNDLYNLISEAALALIRPNGGIATLVVPLSVSFGQDQENTRNLFEDRASQIWLRHQDNRPDKTFHESPVQSRENRQRTTIITAVAGQGKPEVHTTGTNKWRRSEREQYMLSRHYAKALDNNRHANLRTQWPRLPSAEIAYLIETMNRQKATVATLFAASATAKEFIALPMSAYQFITAAPGGSLKRGENSLPIKDEESLELAMAALNGHTAYAWWRIYGDTFHVNEYEMNTVAIPDRWLDEETVNHEVRRLGRLLIDAITSDNITVITTGTKSTKQDSLNFHECVPETIAAIDALYLDALGLPQKGLLEQLHTMRSDSSWRLGTAS